MALSPDSRISTWRFCRIWTPHSLSPSCSRLNPRSERLRSLSTSGKVSGGIHFIFRMLTGGITDTEYDTNWVHLSQLQRFHVAICCVTARQEPRFSPRIPDLIHRVVHNQTSVTNLSIHISCQASYIPLPEDQELLDDQESSSWQALGQRLAHADFSQMSTLRISISMVLIQQEVEVTGAACDRLGTRLKKELTEHFQRSGRALDLAISVQSLRELFPPTA